MEIIYNHTNSGHSDISKDLSVLSQRSWNIKKNLTDNNPKHFIYITDFEKDFFYDSTFHPQFSGVVKLDDSYMFGIRCDHLIWIEGWNENCGTDEIVGEYYTIYVMGNHKGKMCCVKISFLNEEEMEEEMINQIKGGIKNE